MKRIILLLTVLATIAFGSTYSTSEAVQHVGEHATVCGKVVSSKYASSSRGQPTFINLDRAYPNQKFTIVIWGSNRGNFNQPEYQYSRKNVCVTGYIDSYRGVPQIEAESPSQIR